MNAPVPPATDGQADALKHSQFASGYGQGYTSQSESPVDQPDIPQETLQSGEGWVLHEEEMRHFMSHDQDVTLISVCMRQYWECQDF